MKLDDIRMGDTVRLRNGETIIVAHKMEGYTDRDGEHPGPFVAARGVSFDRYLLADVVEVVERNPRSCRFCGEGVTSRDPDIDYCSLCFYTGRALTDERGDLLAALAAIPNVTGANVWHTGGGCFLLAVTLTDGRLIALTDGEAELPEKGQPWRFFAVAENMEVWDEYDESKIDQRDGEWTDEQLIVAVREVAERERTGGLK